MKASRCRISLVRPRQSAKLPPGEEKANSRGLRECEKTWLDRGSRCHKGGGATRSLVCALEQTCQRGCLMSYLGCAMSWGRGGPRWFLTGLASYRRDFASPEIINQRLSVAKAIRRSACLRHSRANTGKKKKISQGLELMMRSKRNSRA